MDIIKFKCTVTPSGYTSDQTALVFGVNLNGVTKFVQCIDKSTNVEIDIVEGIESAEYAIDLVMQGKTSKHTIIDDNNNILSDAVLTVTNISIDDINVDHIIQNNPLNYIHNFNDSGEVTNDKFYDTFGCNGTATFTFTTPFYLWLLENM